MRILTTLAVLTMSTAASSLARAQSMGKPRTAPASTAADTQHVMATDSTVKKPGGTRSPAPTARHGQMGTKAMASDTMGQSAMDGQNHGPDTRKPHTSPAARDTGMTKPHAMSRDSSSTMKKPSAM
jgi:hypothetical protein